MKFYRYFLLVFLVFFACSHLKQAHEMYDSGQYRQTILLCRQALQQDSTDTDAMKLLAGSYYSLGNLDSSLIWYQTLKSTSVRDTVFANEKLARVYIGLSEKLVDEGEYYKAIKVLKSSLACDPASNKTRLLLGNVCQQAGLHEQAAEWYRSIENTADSLTVRDKLSALQATRENASTLLENGIALKNAEKYSKAEKEIEKALAFKPDYKEAKYQLYIVKSLQLYRKGKKSGLWEAIENLGLAATLFPERAEPHYYMAMAYNKKDRDEYDNALGELKLVMEKEPDSKFAKLASAKVTELEKRRKKMNDFLSH